jgi:hypothetical protein
MNNPNENYAYRTFARADLNRHINSFRPGENLEYFGKPENRNRIFRSGLVDVIQGLGITQFTREDIWNTIQRNKIDCLRYMLSLQPQMIQELDMTEEAYICAARPPFGRSQDDIFKMFEYLYLVIGELPTPRILGEWIFDRTWSSDLGVEVFQEDLIADILALYTTEGLKPTDLKTLVSFKKFTLSNYMGTIVSNLMNDLLMPDDVYINIIRQYVISRPVGEEYGNLDGEVYTRSEHIAGGDLYDIMMIISREGRINIFREILPVFTIPLHGEGELGIVLLIDCLMDSIDRRDVTWQMLDERMRSACREYESVVGEAPDLYR